MKTDQIRRTFQEFFEANDHQRLPSASLVPPPSDTSTLLTIAGMQPLKPYFLGLEKPPHHRLVTVPEGASGRPTSTTSAPRTGT